MFKKIATLFILSLVCLPYTNADIRKVNAELALNVIDSSTTSIITMLETRDCKVLKQMQFIIAKKTFDIYFHYFYLESVSNYKELEGLSEFYIKNLAEAYMATMSLAGGRSLELCYDQTFFHKPFIETDKNENLCAKYLSDFHVESSITNYITTDLKKQRELFGITKQQIDSKEHMIKHYKSESNKGIKKTISAYKLLTKNCDINSPTIKSTY
ncbi:hypothetical protein [Vibrio neonatus]|uniref:hypothetical protein n=1 Tax=Vibrio neonatus TaxID=278860 RepID=UPI0021C25CF4|nr:hypothetical protein [Vibrio neonatus]